MVIAYRRCVITTVLLDLDGVIRHFDPAHGAAVEQRHGLAPGALLSAAFASDVLTPAITGEITHVEWVEQVGQLINNRAAAIEWTANRGSVDWEMIKIVDELRAAGTRVCILTNGTSLIPEEMAAFGLVDHFDAVFNSAQIGYIKPDIQVFAHVCDQLGVEPHQVFFTDDSTSKLSGAIELGMAVRQFESVAAFRQHLRDLNIA